MPRQWESDLVHRSGFRFLNTFFFSRPFGLARGTLLATVVTLACTDDGGDQSVAFGPSALEINGAENTAGVRFDRDDGEIALACDARLTVRLGPVDVTPGILLNWDLRPPDNCGDEVTQCGHPRVRFLDADDALVLQGDQVSINPVFDLGVVDVQRIRKIEALLISSTNGKPYLQDGKEVSDRWRVRITAPPEECVFEGTGGTPGSGGSEPGNMAGMGGVGGLDGLGGAR